MDVSLNVRDISIGAVLVASSFMVHRKRWHQYQLHYFGMIPHHSMAVFFCEQVSTVKSPVCPPLIKRS
jgi:hypothetical protein